MTYLTEAYKKDEHNLKCLSVAKLNDYSDVVMEFKVKVIQDWFGEIVGECLVTNSKISFLGDVDLNTGQIVGNDIEIQGQNVKEKIFIFPEGRGSTVGSNVLYGLSRKNLAPKLIITQRAEPITISGAIYGSIPMISEVPDRLFTYLNSGDKIRIFLDGEQVHIEKIE